MAIHSSALTPSYARARAMLSWALPGLLCACSSNPSGPTIVPATDGGRDVAVESAVKDGGGVSDTTTSSDAESTKDAGNTDVDVLPIGTATSAPLATCPGDAYTGATCMTVTVSCSGIADDTATLAITQPGGTAVGTVLLMAGGGGTKFFNIPEISGLLAANFRIVEIEWESAWPQATPASALRGACRAGTLSQWIYDNVHGGAEAAKTTGFCGLGLSGGGAFFTYSVAHYGRKSIYDYLEIMSGPSVAKLDFGCDPSLYDGGPRYVCPDLPNAPFAFTPPTTAWTIAPAGDNQTTTVPNGTLLSNALTSGDVFFGVGGVATATSLAGAGIQAALNAPCQIAITSIGSTFTLSAGASCADTSGTAGTHNFGNIVPLVWFYDSTSTTLIQLTVTSATPSTGTVVYNTSAIAGNNGTMYVSSGGVGQQGPTGPTGAAGTNGIVSAVQADGTPLSTQSTVNFQDAITVNGIGVAWSNPSAGNVKPVITSAPTLGSITGFGTGVATALAANVSGTGAICLTSGSACNSASLTVGTSTVTSGTNTYIEYDNNGVLGEYQFVPIANGGLNSATAAASAVWGNPTGSTAAAQYTTTPIVGSIAVNSTTVPASGYGMNLNSSTSLGWFTAGSEALTLSTGLLIIKGSGTSTANNSLTIQNNNNHAASLGITGTTYSTSPYSADQVVLYETVAAGGMLIGTGNVAPVAFYVDATKVATLGTDYSLGLTLGSKLECTHGSNATCGMAQLSSGTVTVSTTAIGALATSTSGYSVTLTEQTCSGTCGAVQLGTVTGGSSFVINGLSTDNSYVYWEIHYIN